MADDISAQRLLKVEAHVADLHTKVAENALQIQFLDKEVVSGMAGVAASVENGFRSVEKRLDEGAERMEAMSERIGEHGRKLERLDDEKKRSAERWDAAKKFVLPVVTGGGAIGIKELVVWLFHHFA
jgi:chromosome segregation ATPase